MGVKQFGRSLSDFNQEQLDSIIGSQTKIVAPSAVVKIDNLTPHTLGTVANKVWEMVVNLSGSIRYTCTMYGTAASSNPAIQIYKNNVSGAVVTQASNAINTDYTKTMDIAVLPGDTLRFMGSAQAGGMWVKDQKISFDAMTMGTRQLYPLV